MWVEAAKNTPLSSGRERKICDAPAFFSGFGIAVACPTVTWRGATLGLATCSRSCSTMAIRVSIWRRLCSNSSLRCFNAVFRAVISLSFSTFICLILENATTDITMPVIPQSVSTPITSRFGPLSSVEVAGCAISSTCGAAAARLSAVLSASLMRLCRLCSVLAESRSTAFCAQIGIAASSSMIVIRCFITVWIINFSANCNVSRQ